MKKQRTKPEIQRDGISIISVGPDDGEKPGRDPNDLACPWCPVRPTAHLQGT